MPGRDTPERTALKQREKQCEKQLEKQLEKQSFTITIYKSGKYL
jgi:hypothetical protein